MKKLITVISLLLMSSAAFSADITCKVKISDSSDVGRIEEAKAIVLKEESYTQTLDKNEAAVMFSVTGIKGNKALYVNAHVDKNGKF